MASIMEKFGCSDLISTLLRKVSIRIYDNHENIDQNCTQWFLQNGFSKIRAIQKSIWNTLRMYFGSECILVNPRSSRKVPNVSASALIGIINTIIFAQPYVSMRERFEFLAGTVTCSSMIDFCDSSSLINELLEWLFL